jgi:DinB family protein
VLTAAEVRQAVVRAERRFVEVLLAATDEEWRFQPLDSVGVGDRTWSMPQVVEHVTGANEGLLKVLRDVLVVSPRGDQLPDFDDDDMPYIFYGGGGAPPAGLPEPTGRQTDKATCIGGFEASVRAILDWYDGVDVDLRECALTHPAFGLFDGAQWLLFAAVHTRQHRGQLLDLKAACEKAAVL